MNKRTTTPIDRNYGDKKELALKLYAGGKTVEQVAAKLKISGYAVREWAKESGLLRLRGGFHPKDARVAESVRANRAPAPQGLLARAKAIPVVRRGRPSSGITPEHLTTALAYCHYEINAAQVAGALGIQVTGVRGWIGAVLIAAIRFGYLVPKE